MKKKISNKTEEKKIIIDSKFVKNKKTVSSLSKTHMGESDLLFVKLTYRGLTKNDKVLTTRLILGLENVYTNVGVKVIRSNSTNQSMSTSNLKAIAQSLTGSEEVIEKKIIDKNATSRRYGTLQIVTLDISTEVTKNIRRNK